MKKYRVKLINKQVQSVTPTEEDVPLGDTILEEHTGETMWAIIHAETDEQAQEKAERMAQNLQSGEVSERV